MPIQPIGMRYINENGEPNRESYKKIIRSIVNCILTDQFKNLSSYPDSDPLSSESAKETVVDHLNQFIKLINEYSYGEISKS
jgi:hypothetical protein